MAGSVNKAIVVGNVGKDIEVRSTQSGSKIANLTIATSESWNDRASGERKEKTEWHRVTIFNEKLAEIAEKYVVKGCKIYIEGALQTRKWTDNQGVERYTTEIVLANFNGKLEILTSPNRDSGAGRSDDRGGDRQGAPRGGGGRQQSQERPVGQNGSRDPRYSSQTGGGRSNGPSWDAGGGGDLDDEIPF